MLANTLNTNEIKNAAGVEREFQRLSQNERATEYGLITETPSLPHRLLISHEETGSGTEKKRRTKIEFKKSSVGGVDSLKTATNRCYLVNEIPIGNMTTYDDTKEVLANLMSFLATTGAATTVLFDCTGNGASTVVNGGL